MKTKPYTGTKKWLALVPYVLIHVIALVLIVAASPLIMIVRIFIGKDPVRDLDEVLADGIYIFNKAVRSK